MLTRVMNGDLRNYKLYSWLPSLSKYMDARTCFICEGMEPTNFNDRYAVSVVKDDIIVGHLPRLGAISRICSLFLLSLTHKRAL